MSDYVMALLMVLPFAVPLVLISIAGIAIVVLK